MLEVCRRVHQTNRKETQKKQRVRDEALQQQHDELSYGGGAGRGRLLPAGGCWLVPVVSTGANQSRAVHMSPLGDRRAECRPHQAALLPLKSLTCSSNGN